MRLHRLQAVTQGSAFAIIDDQHGAAMAVDMLGKCRDDGLKLGAGFGDLAIC